MLPGPLATAMVRCPWHETTVRYKRIQGLPVTASIWSANRDTMAEK
jgi:hypothetical protein